MMEPGRRSPSPAQVARLARLARNRRARRDLAALFRELDADGHPVSDDLREYGVELRDEASRILAEPRPGEEGYGVHGYSADGQSGCAGQ